jgi:hypothetical protein
MPHGITGVIRISESTRLLILPQNDPKAQNTSSYGTEFFQRWFRSWYCFNEEAFATTRKGKTAYH